VAPSTDNASPNDSIALVIDGCLYALLGGSASSAFRGYLMKHGSLTISSIVNDPAGFHSILREVFGDSANILEDFMKRSLIKELSLPDALCFDLVSTLTVASS